MANEQNLKPVRTKKEARERGRAGGIASAKAYRKRKAMREQMELLLTLPSKDTEIKAKLKELGIEETDIDNQMALMVSTYLQAMSGDTKAVNIVRELVGERVTEINVKTNIDDKVKELDKMLDEI